jgi:AraC-like DNA-binding protein
MGANVHNRAVSKILETYYGATGVPVFGINLLNEIAFYFSDDWNINVFYDYFDFNEVLLFTKAYLNDRRNSKNGSNPCHIFHTKNYFIYIIVFQYESPGITGAILSGPIPAFRPDDARIDELLASRQLSLNRKPEVKSLLQSLPLIPSERIANYCKLLFLLCKPDLSSTPFDDPEVHSGWIKAADPVKSLADPDNDIAAYTNSYKFFMSLREKIVRGDSSGIGRLLSSSTDVLWETGNSENRFYSLKIKYIILCTYTSICSIQAKTPYTIMIKELSEAMEKMNAFKSSDEVVAGMISFIQTCAQAVAIHTKNPYSFHVNQALQYIRTHYTEKISLEVLANHTGINPVYLSSLLKKETKLSLADNINKIRIEESCSLLANTGRSINEIAIAVGYSYQNHFCKVFKKWNGMTPYEYRRKHTNLI